MVHEDERRLRLARLYERYLNAAVDETLSPTDTMKDQWYMPVGRSAAAVVYSACVTGWVNDIKSVLDLPCGHGRVLRHLVKLFPDASFDACDLDRDGVEFCASQFGANPIHSKEELSEVDFEKTYDLIWVGSLFTHTTQERTRRWLRHLAQFLAPNGIVVATFHGRYSAEKGGEFGYIEPSRWEGIRAEYESSGYGYSDYPPKAGHDYMNGSYGVSLSGPDVIVRDVVQIPGVRIFSYTERGWAGHQDVLVFGKPALMA